MNPAQHGFLADRSTESAAAGFLKSAYKRLEEGFLVAGLFFDLSRAFDTINMGFLFDKLYANGLCGPVLDLLAAYFTDRKFCVKVGGEISEMKSIDIGVPQGSVLGPLLFLIFVKKLQIMLTKELLRCSSMIPR